MRKFLVADGGGTKTITAVIDEKGIILGQGYAESGNATLCGQATALRNVLSSINQALASANTVIADIEAVDLYIPGFSQCLEQFVAETNLKVKLCKEEEEIRFANRPNQDKIVVLSGTGSFASAYVGSRTYTVGGWGHLFSDYGSGYDIGKMALEVCAENYDMGKITPLTEELCKEFKINDFLFARKMIYADANARRLIASLCPCVCKLATEGDTQSCQIIERAADKLVKLALLAYEKCGVSDIMPTTLTGGVASAKIVTECFAKKLNERSKVVLSYFEHNPDIIRGAILATLSRYTKTTE